MSENMAANETSKEIQRSALTGVRILDLTRYQQGPFATVLLSDMGAEVIKIEEPGGEPGRATGLGPDGFSAYFEAHNRGKKSMTLDLRTDDAREVIRRLLPSCEVVVENFRPGTMEKWGLGYDDLKKIVPDIILASGSSWGRNGPRGDLPGYDHVGQAFSGVMVEQGGGPNKAPHALVGGFADQIGAMLLAFGVSSALVAKHTFGIGQHVDVSLIGAMTALQSMQITRYLRTGQQLGFEERRAATYTHYLCSDEKYVAIAANTQRFWTRLCAAIERIDLSVDDRFADPFGRADNKDDLVSELSNTFISRSSEYWAKALTDADVPNSVVMGYKELSTDEQMWANGYLQEISSVNLGVMTVPGPPIRMSETPCQIQGSGPELGFSTEELLIELGYSWDEISGMRDNDVI
jgi:crotonobetainyl-CoA:carnitine CoA-transferase CaiB-like acyl-CoA transferase